MPRCIIKKVVGEDEENRTIWRLKEEEAEIEWIQEEKPKQEPPDLGMAFLNKDSVLFHGREMEIVDIQLWYGVDGLEQRMVLRERL